MNERSYSSNGRVTPRMDRGADDQGVALRKRSPLVYWTAVLVVVAMGASALATVLSVLF